MYFHREILIDDQEGQREQPVLHVTLKNLENSPKRIPVAFETVVFESLTVSLHRCVVAPFLCWQGT